MRIDVRVHGDLFSSPIGIDQTIEMPDGSTVLDILRTVAPQHPQVLDSHDGLPPDVNVLVNGRSLRGLDGLGTEVRNGDRLHILRAFGGG